MILHLRASLPCLLFFCFAVHQTEAQGPDQNELDYPVSGIVVDDSGAPVAGVDISIKLHEQTLTTKTGVDGKFELLVAKSKIGNRFVRANDTTNNTMGASHLPWEFKDERHEVGEIRLAPPIEIAVTVVDGNDQPIEGADVIVIGQSELCPAEKTDLNGKVNLKLPVQSKGGFVVAKADQKGLDYLVFNGADPASNSGSLKREVSLKLNGFDKFTVSLTDDDNQPLGALNVAPWLLKKPDLPTLNLSIAGKFFEESTDESGVATFDWIPKWNETQSLVFWPRERNYTSTRIEYFPNAENSTRDLRMSLHALIPVSGCVVDEQGKPVSKLTIRMHGISLDDHHMQNPTTETDGTFSFFAAPNSIYIGEINNGNLRFAEPALMTIKDESVSDLKFKVTQGRRLFGRVTEGSQKSPLVGGQVILTQRAKEMMVVPQQGNAEPVHSRPSMSHIKTTDSEGRFEFIVGAGSYHLVGHNTLEGRGLEIDENSELEFEINFNADRSETINTRGFVYDTAGKPITDASITMVYKSSKARNLRNRIKTDKDGRFNLDRESHACVLYVSNENRQQRAIVELTELQEEVTIHLSNVTTVTGRMVDTNNNPLAEEHLSISYRVLLDDQRGMSTSLSTRTVKTDKNGEFRAEGIVQGRKFTISFVIDMDERGMAAGWRNFQTVTPKAGQTLFQMRDLMYDPGSRPVSRPESDWTFKYEDQTRAAIRYLNGLKKAKNKNRNLLLIFGAPTSGDARQFAHIATFMFPIQSLLQEYETIFFDVSKSQTNWIRQLTGKLGIVVETLSNVFTLVTVDQTGKVISQTKLSDLKNERQFVDQQRLAEILANSRFIHQSAKEQLREALATAKAENKIVLFQASAGWCKRSKELAEVLTAAQTDIEKEVVWLNLDVQSPGAVELMAKIRGKEDSSLPWYGMLDSEGKLIASSCIESGENLGFPWNERSVVQFRKVLQAGTSISDQSLDRMVESISSTLTPFEDD